MSEQTRIETAGRALIELCAEGKDSNTWFARAGAESEPGLFAEEALLADGWARNDDGEWSRKATDMIAPGWKNSASPGF